MTPERYEQIRESYIELVDLPDSDREAGLAELSTRDPELSDEVRGLIEQLSRESALDQPIGDAAQFEESLAAAETRLAIPRQLGPYRIQSRLGCGGMGTVYEAEQDFPRRYVALKVLPPSLVDETSVARLRREADLLGRLRHPGIAQIYEAGVFDESADTFPQAYIAMELIRGERLTEAVSDCTLPQRLNIFVQVCDAVQHAHERGVIHRDLKPSNIMVDSDGRPRVLDFGIGRAVEPDPSEAALRTATGEIFGTVAYMSPEQVRGGSEVTTAADVYSLGVLLYELAADVLPLDLRTVPVLEATRRIQEDEPTRLGTHDADLRGDLEIITAKALEKDPAARYASARALAEDVRRYLSNQPIEARRPSMIYVLRKLARRHRALAFATTVVIIGLGIGVVGLTGGLVAAHRAIGELEVERETAREAEKSARLEADRAVATRSYLFHLLRSGLPDRTQGEALTVRDIIANSDDELREYFSGEPLLEAWAHQMLGQCLFELGDSDRALTHVQRAVELREREGKPDDPELFQALDGLAAVLHDLGANEDAESVARRALAGRTESLGAKHPKTLTSRDRLAGILTERGDWEAAERLHRENLELFREVHGPEDDQTMTVVNNLGKALFTRGQYDEARALFAEVVEHRQRELGSEHPRTFNSQSNLATSLMALDDLDAAIELLEDSLERCREVFPEGHRQTMRTLHKLATAYRRKERPAEAKVIYDEILGRQLEQLGEDHPEIDRLRTNLSAVLVDLEETDLAIEVAGQAVAGSRRRYPDGDWMLVVALSNYARALGQAKRTSEAIEVFEEALGVCTDEVLGPGHHGRYVVQCSYASSLMDVGRTDDADRLSRESLQFLESRLGATHRYTKAARDVLERVAVARGESAESGRSIE